jgi:endoglucanase
MTAALATAGAIALPTTAQAAEQITNGTFDNGTSPWYAYGHVSGSLKVVDGAMCMDVPAGTSNPWDVAFGLDSVPAIAGEGYALSFKAKASRNVTIASYFQHGAENWEQIAAGNPQVTTEFTQFTFDGTSPADYTNGQVVFQVGGKAEAFTFCIDDVSLMGGVEPVAYTPDTGPRVRVNQVGYLPDGPKAATVVTDATAGLEWQLLDAEGTEVASGDTSPKGVDASSAQNVHVIDFSGYTGTGEGFTLTADGETSHPFAIQADLYEPLRKDSKTFFYTNRSGIEILDSIAPGYGRAAGHIGVAPNKGDTAVGCQAASSVNGNWTCTSTFDVSGGWYDAGDHGKYVVNGGISVAQLLSEWERTQYAESVDAGKLGDNTLRVPETGNDIPDILDEAKWELDWMLKMQVPTTTTDAGLTSYAGMAFHKVHDQAWTAIPMDPAKDNQVRELHRPSTAATLNLAAVAAQGARVFAELDPAYSAKLLTAAKAAYAAAKANPAVYAPGTDSTGGGSYADNNVKDEFYWAAAELYLTTGEAAYFADVEASPIHADTFKFDAHGFGWQNVGVYGRLELAMVPGKVAVPGLEKIKASVVAWADDLVAKRNTQAYGQPYAPPAADGWIWGSNSQVLNNLQVIGSAYDLTGDAAYADAFLSGLDYLFGRNALNISYVTGYGTVYAKNQHSRMYANQVESELPNPPAGTVAGGPNSSAADPVADKDLVGCVHQFCYIDDIQSYSTNEITINWNSALSWVSSFAADLDGGI